MIWTKSAEPLPPGSGTLNEACDAEQMARGVVDSIDLHSAPAPARAALRRELTTQLNTGRIDVSHLTTAVGRVFEPRADLHLIRGIPGVTVTVDNIVGCLRARMTAVRPIATGQVGDDALHWAQEEFATSWPDYEAARAARAAHAPEDLQWLFRDTIGPRRPAEESLGTILLLVGFFLLHEGAPIPSPFWRPS